MDPITDMRFDPIDGGRFTPGRHRRTIPSPVAHNDEPRGTYYPYDRSPESELLAWDGHCHAVPGTDAELAAIGALVNADSHAPAGLRRILRQLRAWRA